MSDVDKKLGEQLTERGWNYCKCGRLIDRGDIAWNNGETEAGTPFSTVEVICQACGNEVGLVHTWWPEVNNLEELVEAGLLLRESQW